MNTLYTNMCPACGNGTLKLKLTKSRLYNRYECRCGAKLLAPKRGKD